MIPNQYSMKLIPIPINTSGTGSDINFYLVTVVCVHINYACDKVTDTLYVCGEVIHTNVACSCIL